MVYSPYISPLATLYVGPSRKKYYVRQDLLQRPELDDSGYDWRSLWINLPSVDEDTGHVLVHYLHTGAYETLDNNDATSANHARVEFKRAVLAYFTAKNHGINGLQKLAMQNIERWGMGLTTSDIFNMVDQELPEFNDRPGCFYYYLKKRFKAIFKGDCTSFTDDTFLNHIRSSQLNKIVIECVVELYINLVSHKINDKTNSVQGASGVKVEVGSSCRSTHDLGDPADKKTQEEVKRKRVEEEAPVAALITTSATDLSWAGPPVKPISGEWGAFAPLPVKKKKGKKVAISEIPDALIAEDLLLVHTPVAKRKKTKKAKEEAVRIPEPVLEPLLASKPVFEQITQITPPLQPVPVIEKEKTRKLGPGLEPLLEQEAVVKEELEQPVPRAQPKSKLLSEDGKDDIPRDEPSPEATAKTSSKDIGVKSKDEKGVKKEPRVEEASFIPPLELELGSTPGCAVKIELLDAINGACNGLDNVLDENKDATDTAAAKRQLRDQGWWNVITTPFAITKGVKKEKVCAKDGPEDGSGGPSEAVIQPEETSAQSGVDILEPSSPRLDTTLEDSKKIGRGICPARAKHLLEGDTWKSCELCRAVLCQVAIRLADHVDNDGYEIVERVLIQ